MVLHWSAEVEAQQVRCVLIERGPACSVVCMQEAGVAFLCWVRRDTITPYGWSLIPPATRLCSLPSCCYPYQHNITHITITSCTSTGHCDGAVSTEGLAGLFGLLGLWGRAAAETDCGHRYGWSASAGTLGLCASPGSCCSCADTCSVRACTFPHCIGGRSPWRLA
jgi:hypothetical protein